MLRIFLTVGLLLGILVGPTGIAAAADVLRNLPPDALGFVHMREVGSTDGKIQQLISNLGTTWNLGPLEFLRVTTGIRAGLDHDGEFLLAVLPAPGDDSNLEFCVWLPVSNYERLLRSLESSRTTGITAVTIAGEDLLIARHGRWALVMDPDQRERMERMLAARPPAESVVTSWEDWIDANDVTVAALPGGVDALVQTALGSRLVGPAADAEQGELSEDLFGPVDEAEVFPERRPGASGLATSFVAQAQTAFRELQAAAPALRPAIDEMQFGGVGLQLDAVGNTKLRVRAAWDRQTVDVEPAASESAPALSLPAPTQDGELLVAGVGRVPRHVATALATFYVRLMVNELRTQERMQLDEETLVRFYQAVEQSAAETTNLAVYTRPGAKHDGVYTNNFLAVRVSSADRFIDLAGEAIRLWNQLQREARGGMPLVFDVSEQPVGDTRAIEYSLDIAAAEGGPILPETRQAMEKLFGPGGKLRLFIAKADDQTVLLAAATPEQTGAVLEKLHRNRTIEWTQPPTAQANGLLPAVSDWRVFFSPHGYTTWKARQMDAIVGPDVIGGPLVKQFPATPAIGAAGGMQGGEFWAELAVPAETIRGAGAYWRSKDNVQPARR